MEIDLVEGASALLFLGVGGGRVSGGVSNGCITAKDALGDSPVHFDSRCFMVFISALELY